MPCTQQVACKYFEPHWRRASALGRMSLGNKPMNVESSPVFLGPKKPQIFFFFRSLESLCWGPRQLEVNVNSVHLIVYCFIVYQVFPCIFPYWIFTPNLWDKRSLWAAVHGQENCSARFRHLLQLWSASMSAFIESLVNSKDWNPELLTSMPPFSTLTYLSSIRLVETTLFWNRWCRLKRMIFVTRNQTALSHLYFLL